MFPHVTGGTRSSWTGLQRADEEAVVGYTKAAVLAEGCCVPSAMLRQVVPPCCKSPWDRTPLPKSIHLASSIQDPTSRQWDHDIPLLEESTELATLPFPQNKQATISPCPQLSCESGNVQNAQAAADGMCDDYSYPGSGASTWAVQGPGCCAAGLQAPVADHLQFFCLLFEIQQRQRLSLEVTIASSDQQARNLGPQHLSSDRYLIPVFVISFPADSPVPWAPMAVSVFCSSCKIPQSISDAVQELVEKSLSRSTSLLPACRGLNIGGCRCTLQPEQFNPDLHFLAYQTGGVLDFGLKCLAALQQDSSLLHQALAWGNQAGPEVLHSNLSTLVSCSSSHKHYKGSSNY